MMPTFVFTSPSGESYEVSGPKGATKEQAFAKFKQARPELFATKAAPKKAAPTVETADIIKQAPGRAAASVVESIVQTPENIANLAKMAYGVSVTEAGYPGLAPQVEAPPQRVTPALERAGVLKRLEGMTPAQRALDVGLQAGVMGLASPAQAGRQIAERLSTGGKALIGGAAGEGVTQATDSELAGIATSMLAPGALTKASQSRLAAAEANQPVVNAFKEARKAGYKVVPTDVEPTTGRRIAQSLASPEALKFKLAEKNQKITDKLAKQAIGLKESSPLNEEVLSNIRKEAYQRGYKPLEQAGRVGADLDYMFELNNVATKYAGATASFPQAVKDKVAEIVNAHRESSFEPKDALKRISDLRADATSAFKRNEDDQALAMRAVADALENQLERHLASVDPRAIKRFRESRKLIAKTHAIEGAMMRDIGSVDATKLAGSYQRGAPLSGELETIAKTANTFKNAFKQPGKEVQQEITGLRPLTSAAAGLMAGLASGNPLTGILGALAPAATGAGARAYIMSPLGQRAIMPGAKNVLARMGGQPITDPVLLNALMASAASNRSEQ